MQTTVSTGDTQRLELATEHYPATLEPIQRAAIEYRLLKLELRYAIAHFQLELNYRYATLIRKARTVVRQVAR